VDPKYTKAVLTQCEAVRKWLEEAFGDVGTGQPGVILIRICENYDEARSFYSGSAGSGWESAGFEVTTYKDLSEGKQSMAFQSVSRYVMGIWFREKNQELAWAMPAWANNGLDQYVMTSLIKGGRLAFKADPWEFDQLRTCKRNNTLKMPSTMMRSTTQEYFDMENGLAQAGAFVRYLLDGPGSQDKKLKGKFVELLRNTGAYVAEREAAEKAAEPETYTAPQTEEEEAERYRQMRQAWKEREKELNDEILKRTFPDWEDKDWARLDAMYEKHVK
jgi:hypothetical protein